MSILDFVKGAAVVVYGLLIVFMMVQGTHSLWLLIRFLRHRPKSAEQFPPIRDGDEPHVLLQLPIFNERDVVVRLLESMGRLDWPADRLRIQLLDDSTDDTVAVAAEAVARLRSRGLDVNHVRRPDREGYKAGALAYGLLLDAEDPRGAAPLVAIFDADFVPGPDFLKRAVPRLISDDRYAFVQGRWEHLNPDAGILTRAQAMGIDGHFAIEQGARAWSGLALNFNGTCGIWRRAAILESGGWQHDTLTEDLDLSYRAQLQGWRAAYDLDLTVPGELPGTLEAWRSQQFRWAKGSIETSLKLLPTIWRSEVFSATQKLFATLHLSHYLVHPAILLSLLLAPLVMGWAGYSSPLAFALGAPLILLGLVPPLILYVVSQRLLARPLKSLLALPALMSFGVGTAFSNTRAVVEALRGQRSAFVRTPKQGESGKSYRAVPSTGLAELLMAAWGLVAIAQMLTGRLPWFAPLMVLYTCGFLIQGAVLLKHRLKEVLAEDTLPEGPFWPWPVLGALALGATALLAQQEDTWRDAPLTYTGLGLALGACLMVGMELGRRTRLTGGGLAIILMVGVLLPFAASGMLLSDDLSRYAVEGHQVRAGENPYAVAPSKTRLAVPPEVASRVNHAHMTAIYPPLMLWLHGSVMGLGLGTLGFRVAAIAAVFLGAVLILALLLGLRKSPVSVLAWLWNPVVVFFAAGEGHHDVFMAVALLAAALAYERNLVNRSLVMGTVATLLKPFAGLALLFLLASSSIRRLWIPAVLSLLAILPFLSAGSGILESLLAFGGSMNFHGVLEPALRTLASTLVPGLSAAAVVRVLLVILLIVGQVWLYMRSRREPMPWRIARSVALLLAISPTLHPWYFTVLAAFLPFASSRALLGWTAAAPLYWLHGVAMPEGQAWAEWPVATALAHVPFFIWMVVEAVALQSERRAVSNASSQPSHA